MRCLAGILIAITAVSAAAAETVEVAIRDFRFVPARVSIRAGDTVRWTNQEKRASHSVLFTAEALESERLFPGESWSRRFDGPGSQAYRCGPHPEMEGVVEVRGD
ncbi:plastocyanin/azurin family copper-binding protein [Zoogloea sp.]|jgi:plastocyanin|uniref:cupredoxin domain-containing protein n=1 Tax=Zoogloea sp. TaxID=49181 RepID=UPI0025FC12D0|nr:plastocyanin/azurin family copper-binding protein [Zoogloea sp.]MCK6393211.1 plastocyanin/azurin family copper-binding protein [Zoogloea sp.]